MNPFTLGRSAVRFAKAQKDAFDVWRLCEEAAATPARYRDPVWRARLRQELGELISNLPLPKGIQIMLRAALVNWQTTVAGFGLTFAAATIDAVQNGLSWKQAFLVAAGTVFGALAKDGKVTGGTKPATPEADARVKWGPPA